MTVNEQQSRLWGVRHSPSLTTITDTLGAAVSESATDFRQERDADALGWADRIGVGALADTMGITLQKFTINEAIATMPVMGNTQPFGLLHGGAYAVLGETLGSMSAALWAAPEGIPVGVDINATHTNTATTGTVTGVCRPIHLGRTMTVHEIVVTNEDGKRCSTIRITNYIRGAKR